jgi:recombination protein RecA
MEIIAKSGAFLSYGENRLGQGRENARQFLDEKSDIAAEIEKEIRGKLNMRPEAPETDEEEG